MNAINWCEIPVTDFERAAGFRHCETAAERFQIPEPPSSRPHASAWKNRT